MRALVALALLVGVARADPSSLLGRVARGTVERYHHTRNGEVLEKRARLDAGQLARALEIVRNPSYSSDDVAMCFNPHHRLILGDATGHEVGRVDVCFECTMTEATRELELRRGITSAGVKAWKKLFQSAGVSTRPSKYNDDLLSFD